MKLQETDLDTLGHKVCRKRLPVGTLGPSFLSGRERIAVKVRANYFLLRYILCHLHVTHICAKIVSDLGIEFSVVTEAVRLNLAAKPQRLTPTVP